MTLHPLLRSLCSLFCDAPQATGVWVGGDVAVSFRTKYAAVSRSQLSDQLWSSVVTTSRCREAFPTKADPVMYEHKCAYLQGDSTDKLIQLALQPSGLPTRAADLPSPEFFDQVYSNAHEFPPMERT